MPDIWPGAGEIRVRDSDGTYRTFYVIVDLVMVVHVFTKKTEKTPRHEIEVARKRIKEILRIK